MRIPESLKKPLSRLQDEALNIGIWIGKVAIVLKLFDWALRHYGIGGFGDVLAMYAGDGDIQPFGIGILFVLAVCIYTITRR